jgi:hypothetical protein
MQFNTNEQTNKRKNKQQQKVTTLSTKQTFSHNLIHCSCDIPFHFMKIETSFNIYCVRVAIKNYVIAVI